MLVPQVAKTDHLDVQIPAGIEPSQAADALRAQLCEGGLQCTVEPLPDRRSRARLLQSTAAFSVYRVCKRHARTQTLAWAAPPQ